MTQTIVNLPLDAELPELGGVGPQAHPDLTSGLEFAVDARGLSPDPRRSDEPLPIPILDDLESLAGAHALGPVAPGDAMQATGEMADEPEPQMPPERVRFTAPATVRREGSDEISSSAIFNLSVRGVACSVPAKVSVGERAWIQFSLALADEPLNLLCEVIWCSQRDEAEPVAGLRFSSLTREEHRRIQAAVTQRSQGRAGAWPLPVMPEPPAPAPQRGPSPAMSAAAGMAAGIALALALSVIPTASVGSPTPSVVRPAGAVPGPRADSSDGAKATNTGMTSDDATTPGVALAGVGHAVNMIAAGTHAAAGHALSGRPTGRGPNRPLRSGSAISFTWPDGIPATPGAPDRSRSGRRKAGRSSPLSSPRAPRPDAGGSGARCASSPASTTSTSPW